MKTEQEIERDKLWSYMIAQEIATERELQLVSSINGFTLETNEMVLYCRTGYRSLDQLLDEEGDAE